MTTDTLSSSPWAAMTSRERRLCKSHTHTQMFDSLEFFQHKCNFLIDYLLFWRRFFKIGHDRTEFAHSFQITDLTGWRSPLTLLHITKIE